MQSEDRRLSDDAASRMLRDLLEWGEIDHQEYYSWREVVGYGRLPLLGEVQPKKEYSRITAWKGGQLLQVRRASWRPLRGDRQRGGVRGSVLHFSQASRRRMLRSVASVRVDRLPVFVTLTYPGEFSDDFRDWKDDLRKMAQRIGRKYPGSAFHWKLEDQKRGAPHYHLLVYGLPDVDAEMRSWFSQAWYEVVGSGDVRHLRAGTRVERVKSRRGVIRYASKYLGKVSENSAFDDGVGRYWGVYFRSNVPWADQETIILEDNEVHEFFRLLRRYAGLRRSGWKSQTVFVANPERWLDVVPGVVGAFWGKQGPGVLKRVSPDMGVAFSS